MTLNSQDHRISRLPYILPLPAHALLCDILNEGGETVEAKRRPLRGATNLVCRSSSLIIGALWMCFSTSKIYYMTCSLTYLVGLTVGRSVLVDPSKGCG